MKYFILFVVSILFYGCGKIETEFRHELINLNVKSGIHGDFFLGCGSINDKEYYAGFANTPNGIVRFKISMDEECYIHYIDRNTTPYMTGKRHFGIKSLEQDSLWCNRFDFYIPQGSIINNYTLK